MTANKAIKNLRTIKGKYAWNIRDDDALETAIDALKKQIPKEPMEEDHSGEVFEYRLYCPSCGSCIGYRGRTTGRIAQKYGNEYYCGKCSQAIDWKAGEG